MGIAVRKRRFIRDNLKIRTSPKKLLFSDYFRRVDTPAGTVSGGWYNSAGFQIVGNSLYVNGVTQYCQIKSKTRNPNKIYEAYFEITGTGTHFSGQTTTLFQLDTVVTDNPTQSSGLLTEAPGGVAIGLNTDDSTIDVYDADSSTRLSTAPWTWTSNNTYAIRFRVWRRNIWVKVWNILNLEPALWNIQYIKSTDIASSGNGFMGWNFVFASADIVTFNNLQLYELGINKG